MIEVLTVRIVGLDDDFCDLDFEGFSFVIWYWLVAKIGVCDVDYDEAWITFI